MEVKGIKVTTRGKLLIAATMIIILVATFQGVRGMTRQNHERTLNNAIVACDFVGISPKTTAEIKHIVVAQGQKVKKGDVVFQLDSKDAASALKRAATMLDIAKTELEKATGGARIQEIAAAQTLVLQANADRDSKIAERDSVKATLKSLSITYDMLLKQLKAYRNPGNGAYEEEYAIKLVNLAYSKQQINDTQFSVQAQLLQQQFEFKGQLEAQLTSLKGRIRSLEASVEASKASVQNTESRLNLVSDGVSNSDMTILVNKVKAAQIVYDNAKEKVSAATVKATRDGTIANITEHVGEMAVPGSPVLYLADMNNMYIYALVDEKKLDEVKLGQSLKIRMNVLKDEVLTGTISEIGSTTLEFIDNNPNKSFKSSMDGHKVPVKIKFDSKKYKLIPGMHAEIYLQ